MQGNCVKFKDWLLQVHEKSTPMSKNKNCQKTCTNKQGVPSKTQTYEGIIQKVEAVKIIEYRDSV